MRKHRKMMMAVVCGLAGFSPGVTRAAARTDAVLDFSHASARVAMATDLYPQLTNLTLSVWVKTAAPPAAGSYGAIAGRGYLGGGMAGFGLYVNGSNSNVAFQTRSTTSAVTAAAPYPFDGRWHHLAGVREGDTLRLYLDGEFMAGNTGAPAGMFSTGVAFGLGARHQGTSWGYYFDGAIAEVRLWDGARTQAQIREDMFRCLSGAEPGLAGYWPLSEGAGGATDLSGAGNHGTRSNAYWSTDVTFGPMLAADNEWLGWWPATLADLRTGDTRLTASNVVSLTEITVPEGCNAFQINPAAAASALDPGAWASTDGLPGRIEIPGNAGRASVYAWFTNTAADAPLRRSPAAITRFPVEAALDFRAAATSRVAMATNLWPGLADLTLAAWIKPVVKPAAGSYGAIAGRGYLYPYNGFGLFIAGNGRVYFQTRTGNTVILQPSAEYPFDDTWHHVAGVRDGNATRLYLDGSFVAETNGTHTSLFTAGIAFGLGARHQGTSWGYFFDGTIAEVQLWNRARTQVQIREDMFRCLSGAEAGLIGYWPLSEGAGTAVTDRTDAGNDGVRVNAPVWLADAAETARLPASRDPVRLGWWPFALADLETGRTAYTDSNVVAVAAFPVPEGCDVCQIGPSPAAEAVSPSAWLPVDPAPDRLTLAQTADGKPSVLYAWFTNTADNAAMRRSGASIVYTSGHGGPALVFSNAATRVEMASGLWPSLSNLTLQAWVHAQKPAEGGMGCIPGRGYLADSSGFGLYLYGTGNAIFQTRQNAVIVSASAAYPFDGNWHHLAGVRDGDTTRLYLDGGLAAENEGALASLFAEGVPFGLGARFAASWAYFLNGALAEVRLYDRARSAKEIRADMTYRLTGAEPGLIGYWPLDEGGGCVVGDRSPAGNDGRVSGETWVFIEDFMREERPPPGLIITVR